MPKCMYNIAKGPKSKSPYLYCMPSSNVLDPRYWKRPPDRDRTNNSFQPILDIPLSRVHICTMHALCQIEKLVFFFFFHLLFFFFCFFFHFSLFLFSLSFFFSHNNRKKTTTNKQTK